MTVPSVLLEQLRRADIPLETSPRRLSEYAYDASNYRITPVAVAFPRSVAQVQAIVRASHANGIPVVARGGGTSMAGNAIGPGVVVDLSRHFTAIREIDTAALTVDVDPGVVLATLSAEVERRTDGRFTFAPDPSSRTRATVGGAIGNDACGNHSVRHGRTSDHVIELDVITSDGARLTAFRGGVRATSADDKLSVQRAAQLTADLTALVTGHLHALRTELGRIPRQVSGYHLQHLLPEHGFDVARALVGSEGSCAIVVGARVRLVPVPTATLLLCLGYDDVIDAARDVTTVLTAQPTAVEGIDEQIVAAMRWRRGASSVQTLPAGRAWLFVELDGDDADHLHARAQSLLAEIGSLGRLRDGQVVTDPTERAALWRVREDGAGLSSRLAPSAADPNPAESWPGWEDSAVAPERLADYVADLRELLNQHGLTGVMYGHFGAGCVHIRITYDLRTAAGRLTFREFTQDAARLVVRHGGTLSGEHGDGRARSELLPLMYSPELLTIFTDYQRLWDPHGLLSVASLARPALFTADLALSGVPDRRWQTTMTLDPAPSGVAPFVDAVQRCIGVGRCRTTSGGVMCPSFRATRDEKDSTRGRARVLQDMIRTSDSTRAGWASADVAEALDLCLSCRACSTDCPTGVDLATLKSEFWHQHYRRRLRPWSHYVLGWLPTWLRLTAQAPGVARSMNWANSSRASKAGRRWVGLTTRRDLPQIADPTAWIREAVAAGAHRPGSGTGDVVLLVDTFTRGFRPQVAGAAAAVLGAAGPVECAESVCCALTWISTGQLTKAQRVLARTVAALDDGTTRPIVVPEPSCAAALRHDLPRLIPTAQARSVAARVRSFAAHLADTTAIPETGAQTQQVILQQHCHEYAIFGASVQHPTLVAVGADIVAAPGCCGMAGHFGFEADHVDVSMAVAGQALLPAIAATPDDVPVLTDGFSCALQVAHLAPGRRTLHLAEYLRQQSSGSSSSG